MEQKKLYRARRMFRRGLIRLTAVCLCWGMVLSVQAQKRTDAVPAGTVQACIVSEGQAVAALPDEASAQYALTQILAYWKGEDARFLTEITVETRETTLTAENVEQAVRRLTIEDPLPVETRVVKTYTQMQSCNRLVLEDKTAFADEPVLCQEGNMGEILCTELQIWVSGRLTGRKTLSSQVLRPAADWIYRQGTQEKPDWWPTGKLLPPVLGAVSSEYGVRGSGFHTGMDITGDSGDPILAADGGQVVFAGSAGGYGAYLVIDHGRYATAYAHLSALYVCAGDTVRRGDTIAAMGSTGRSTGVHLHFEVMLAGETLSESALYRQWGELLPTLQCADSGMNDASAGMYGRYTGWQGSFVQPRRYLTGF